MTITDRNLPAGTLLKATYKATEYLAEITTYESEKNLTLNLIGIGPKDPQSLIGPYSSLSKAAMAITGNSVNGWRFWTLAAPPAGKVTDQDVIDRIDGILTTTEPLYIGDDIENTPLPPAKAPRTARKPAVARLEETIDPDDVAGVKQPCAAEDPGFGNGGTFTVDAKRAKPRSFTPIKATPNQRGLEAGQTRMWCHGCQRGFTTDQDPAAFKADDAECPEGHRVGAMREAALGNNQED